MASGEPIANKVSTSSIERNEINVTVPFSYTACRQNEKTAHPTL